MSVINLGYLKYLLIRIRMDDHSPPTYVNLATMAALEGI
jgi:hypothetical protein